MSSACPGCECTRQHLKYQGTTVLAGPETIALLHYPGRRRQTEGGPPTVGRKCRWSPESGESAWQDAPAASARGPTRRLPPGRDENAYAASIRDTGQRPGAFPGDAISSSAYHVDLDADQPFHPLTYLAHRVGDLSACRDELGSRCVIGARPRRAREYPHIAVFWLPLGCVAAPLGLQGQFLVVPVLVAVEDGG